MESRIFDKTRLFCSRTIGESLDPQRVRGVGVGVDAATGSIWPQVRPEHEVPNKGV